MEVAITAGRRRCRFQTLFRTTLNFNVYELVNTTGIALSNILVNSI